MEADGKGAANASIVASDRTRDRTRYRVSELPPHHFRARDDDDLGAMASRAALSAVPWTPDVAGAVTDRLARDAAAYPEHFAAGAQAALTGSPATKPASVSGSTHRANRRANGGIALAIAGLATSVAVIGASVFLGAERTSDPSVTASVGQRVPLAAERELAVPPLTDLVTGTEAADLRAQGSTVLAAVDASAATPDVVEPRALAIVAARPVLGGSIGALVQLGGPRGDKATKVHRTQLLRKMRDGVWKPVAATTGRGPLKTTLIAGRRYDFRVRALDEDGKVISSRRLRALLTVRPWASQSIRRTRGDWTTTMGDPKLGGALASKTAHAAITTSFTGGGVALVAPVGPAGGAMRVRVDGGDWERGNLSDPESDDRVVVFSRELEDGRHSLDIAVDDGVIALDSMMIVRTPERWPRKS